MDLNKLKSVISSNKEIRVLAKELHMSNTTIYQYRKIGQLLMEIKHPIDGMIVEFDNKGFNLKMVRELIVSLFEFQFHDPLFAQFFNDKIKEIYDRSVIKNDNPPEKDLNN